MSTTLMNRSQIEELAKNALESAGAISSSAKSLARAVAAAEMDGISSHGLVYVPIYCEHLTCGKVIGVAIPEVTTPVKASVMVDAGCGFAHPAIDAGFAKLIVAARELGCAGMGIRNSYNCGVLGYHVERLAQEGLLALGFTNAPASIMPVGGNTPVIGTNPFAVGVPAGKGERCFVMDQSASVVAKSEIKVYAQAGKDIPDHWAFDSDGNPTSDANEALKGSMAPTGGYKGFGTGLMTEIFAAVLAGATLGKDASPFAGTAGGPPKTGQFFFAVSPEAFSGDQFTSQFEILAESISSQDGARLPGSRRLKNRDYNEANGVAVKTDLIEKIKTLNG